jgi:hypothetical protein
VLQVAWSAHKSHCDSATSALFNPPMTSGETEVISFSPSPGLKVKLTLPRGYINPFWGPQCQADLFSMPSDVLWFLALLCVTLRCVTARCGAMRIASWMLHFDYFCIYNKLSFTRSYIQRPLVLARAECACTSKESPLLRYARARPTFQKAARERRSAGARRVRARAHRASAAATTASRHAGGT